MSKYRYKKEFLGEFMRRKGLSAYALKDVLGIKSVNHIDVWSGKKPLPELERPKEDQGWLPLVHILKICNTYPNDVTLGDFIEGADESDLVRTMQSPPAVAQDYRRIITEKDREITDLQQKVTELKELIAQLKADMANERLDHEKILGVVKDQMREKYQQREDQIRRDCDKRVIEIVKSFATVLPRKNVGDTNESATDKEDNNDSEDLYDHLLANEPLESPRP